jgi:hypothetical protein
MRETLTVKQEAFVEAYLGEAFGNATQAAALAKYKGNDATLAEVGAENLRKPYIQEAIKDRKAKLRERTEYTPELAARMLFRAYDIGEAHGHSSAMTSACRELNQLHGLYPAPGQAVQVNFNPHCSAREQAQNGPERTRIAQDGRTLPEGSPGPAIEQAQSQEANGPKEGRGEGFGGQSEDK